MFSLFCPVCIGCFDGTYCCARAWGKCVLRCPEWDSCCSRISDPICEAENVACEALKAPIQVALAAARELVESTGDTLQVANYGLAFAEAALTVAEEGVNAAQDFLDGIESTYAVGLKVAESIAEVGLNGLVDIREISFDVGLDVASGGAFFASVRAVFAGAAEVTISLDINLYDITSMVKDLADRIGDGFSSLF